MKVCTPYSVASDRQCVHDRKGCRSSQSTASANLAAHHGATRRLRHWDGIDLAAQPTCAASQL
eukprot:724311-Amphidinium_carterae.1